MKTSVLANPAACGALLTSSAMAEDSSVPHILSQQDGQLAAISSFTATKTAYKR